MRPLNTYQIDEKDKLPDLTKEILFQLILDETLFWLVEQRSHSLFFRVEGAMTSQGLAFNVWSQGWFDGYSCKTFFTYKDVMDRYKAVFARRV